MINMLNLHVFEVVVETETVDSLLLRTGKIQETEHLVIAASMERALRLADQHFGATGTVREIRKLGSMNGTKVLIDTNREIGLPVGNQRRKALKDLAKAKPRNRRKPRG